MIEIRMEIHVCNVGVHAPLLHCVVFFIWRERERGGGGVAIITIILFEVSFGCFLP